MKRRSAQTSRRLLAAVAAERDDLYRRRKRIEDRRDALRAQVADLDAELAELIERVDLLERLAGPQPEVAASRAESPITGTLKGPAIRHVAVELLLADPRRPEALHYRDWYKLVSDAGYAIAGKDPAAVFLTQLSRSPIVRHGTQSGVYELDRSATGRLRRQLDDRQRELRDLASSPARADRTSEVRTRRSALTREIGKLEKALEEAELLLAGESLPLAMAS